MMMEEEGEAVVLEELHRYEEESEEDNCRGDRVEGELVIFSQTHNNNKPHEVVLDSRNDEPERSNASNGNGAKENGQTILPKSANEITKKEKRENNLKFTRKAPSTSFPSLAPLKESDIPEISTSFFAALREENGIQDPCTLFKNCYEVVKVLKARHVLDGYVINEDEAAVLCSIPMLLNGNEDNFSIQKMVESCTEKPPSKLFVMMLTALRKLPRYKGVMYIKSENQKKLRTRKKGSIAQPSFCVASKRMSKISEERDTSTYSEVFNIERGWGYDISDFVVERDESGRYVPLCPEGLIIIEPWRTFEVIDPGIQRFEEKISKVPLRMVENVLIYEKEIIPNVSLHVIKAIKGEIDDVSLVKRMLNILTSQPFDTEYDNRDTFRDAGGIECLIECYEKHNELAKEVINCLMNIIKNNSKTLLAYYKPRLPHFLNIEASAYIIFIKGFIKTITEITLANINDEPLCLKTSLMTFCVADSIDFFREGAIFFSDIKRFKLILALLITHRSNDEICGYALRVLLSFLSYSSTFEISDDELAQFFDSGIIETISSIMENSENEFTLSICKIFLGTILNKEFDKYPNIDAYRDFLIRKMEAVHERFDSLKLSEERNKNLSIKLSINNEPITYSDILAALKGIEVSEPEDILKECKEVVKSRWSKINNRYLLSEEEAILITSYTYENKLDVEMSPYRILNKELRENDIQDQISNNKSYLRLLLRVLRKLPRTEPQTLYRGIKDDKNKYSVGEELPWNGFSSTSTSMKVTQDFLTNQDSGKICGTLFEIRGMWGYNVSDFSTFYKERETLLEPMLKFTVKSVTEQESFTIVALEPLNQPLFLEDDVPTGCIQHIISSLMDNMESKEVCVKTCGILCNIKMDDDNSPDSRKVFKEYNGIRLLCDLFEKHKDSNILNALVHAIGPLDMLINEEATKSVGMIVGDILSEETTDEQTTTVLLDGLSSFKDKSFFIFYNTELFKGLVAVIDRFTENRSLCLRSLSIISYLYGIKNEEGAIDVIIRALKTYVDDPSVCEFGCGILAKIFPEDNNECKKRAREEGWIEVVLNILNIHIDNEIICGNSCSLLNEENQEKMVQANGIEIVLGVMDKHSDNYIICVLICINLSSIVINNSDNQEKIKVMNGIDSILKVMNTQIDNCVLCAAGCCVLFAISNANSSVQKYACEKGCINTLLSILAIHKDSRITCEACCLMLAIIFSSNELHSKFCTENVLNCVQECCEIYDDSEEILHFLLSLIREEDPKVRDAVARGVCTGEAFPKCKDDCGSDKNDYCHKCCVQQKVFKCFTCDKKEVKVYCEACWKRDHQGHRGEEFFLPVRCATK